MLQFSTYYNQTLQNIKAYWGHGITNSTLSTTIVDNFVPSPTYNRVSTSFSSHRVHNKDFITMTDINLPGQIGFDTKGLTVSSSGSAVIQHIRAVTTIYHELQTHPYLSGLDFLFPPEKKTECAISVTPLNTQQRLINFSDRVHHTWNRPYQLLESRGELKCTQILTGERDYNSFLFYFFIVSLLFNVILGTYIKRKYGGFQFNTAAPVPDKVTQGNTAVPSPRNYQRRAVPNPRNVNQVNVVPNLDQENIPPRQGYNPGEELRDGLDNLLRRIREMRRINAQQVLPVRRDIRLLRRSRNR